MLDTRQQLLEIADRAAKAGERVAQPASQDCIRKLRSASLSQLSFEIPEEFAAFLSLSDGLDHNGYLIYSSGCEPGDPASFIDRNLEWRKSGFNASTIFFADTGLDAYVLEGGEFIRQDRVSGDHLEAFATLDAMLAEVLHQMLVS